MVIFLFIDGHLSCSTVLIIHVSFAGHLDKLLRSLVIGRLASCADESIVTESKRRFNDHASGKSLIPADLRSAVYRAVMSSGNEQTYDALLKVLILVWKCLFHYVELSRTRS